MLWNTNYQTGSYKQNTSHRLETFKNLEGGNWEMYQNQQNKRRVYTMGWACLKDEYKQTTQMELQI
jgi:hypothetical protein